MEENNLYSTYINIYTYIHMHIYINTFYNSYSTVPCNVKGYSNTIPDLYINFSWKMRNFFHSVSSVFP